VRIYVIVAMSMLESSGGESLRVIHRRGSLDVCALETAREER